MDPRYCAQDVIRCDLCKTPAPPMYCDLCHIKLCKACAVDHIFDISKEHKVLPFEQRGSTINYPNCGKHATKKCELHCQHCDIPICTQCVSSGEHVGHKHIKITEIFTSKKQIIKEDLKELEESIYPRYQKAASNISVQKASARKNSQELKTALTNHGEAIHKEIDNIIQNMHDEIDEMDFKNLAVIGKQEYAIQRTSTEIEQTILDLRKLLDTSDVSLVSEYSSRNEEFRRLPAQFHVTLPTFIPQQINREQIFQQFGSLSIITTEEHGGPVKIQGAVSSTRPLIDEPRILTDIKTEYGGDNKLLNVSCLSDSEVWTCGMDNIMRLYNLQGELLNSVQTKSGNWPHGIAVTLNRNLLYTDPDDSSINIVKNKKIKSLIRLRNWSPRDLCSTSYGDLLVLMVSDDLKQAKVVRYSGSTENQSIQWDDEGNPLYTSNISTKCLSENRNFEVCLADRAARAVVVVSADGKLRFRYTGPSSATKTTFDPVSITTDSQSRILIADGNNHRIHILDQDGYFLRYIEKCGLQSPWGLCVDSADNLFVAEYDTGRLKKIQYYK